MKNFTLFILLLSITFTVNAQIDIVSAGANYVNQGFYNLSDKNQKINAHTNWDIAFSIIPQTAGILVNEAVAASFSAPLPEVELYESIATDFATADTTNNIVGRIYNNEKSWTAGAFNHIQEANDPFDYGWGTYDMTTHFVNGSRIFFIKLRNGIYKKLEIQSLSPSGLYTFRYADLDGSNEITQTINKANFSGQTLAYFSLENNVTVDVEPQNWDFQITRYITSLDDGNGGIIDYLVTGILHNENIKVAQADNINPQTVDYQGYENDLVDENQTLDIIGHDWKSFDLTNFQWVLPTDRVYFVQTATDSLWKIEFIDFSGSSSGEATFEATFETVLTSTNSVSKNIQAFSIYPNPIINFVNLAFELENTPKQASTVITNTLGQIVFNENINVQLGLNIKKINLNLESGQYFLTLNLDGEQITKTLLVP